VRFYECPNCGYIVKTVDFRSCPGCGCDAIAEYVGIGPEEGSPGTEGSPTHGRTSYQGLFRNLPDEPVPFEIPGVTLRPGETWEETQPLRTDPSLVEKAAAWHFFLPPARPSSAEAARYREAATAEDKNLSGSWCVFGSTPEIRSLAASEGRQLFCVDRSWEMFVGLTPLVEPRPHRETFVLSNWLDMTTLPAVDILFADGSINMLPSHDQGRFVEVVSRCLKPGSLALLRVHLTSAPEFSTPEEVFRWYRTTCPHIPVFSATRHHLDMLWMDRETMSLDLVESRARIRTLYEAGLASREEFQAYDRILHYNRIRLHYSKRETFESLCRRHFTIERVLTGGDYPGSQYHPVYALRRRP
jgi:hypothetical protein